MKTGVDKRSTVLLICLVTVRTKISLMLKVAALADRNIYIFLYQHRYLTFCACVVQTLKYGSS